MSSGDLTDEYHVFSITWDDSFIRWYVDDTQYPVIDATPEELQEFRENFFFIINLAIGGDKGAGDPVSTEFPRWLIIDYIRIFKAL